MLDDKAYRDLGFRAGLEVHQQLDTKQKLFCRCPVGLNNAEPEARITRHMRPTLSELGEYDGTALMEFKTKKTVVYELLRESMCTYEIDDTPPFRINQTALDIALEISLLFNCITVDEIHITRKQYLDGSIPAGFQRTAVVGLNGWIPFRGRRIGIMQVNLEEDSCREVKDEGHTIVWRTDRLSTPLVEVITEPALETPEEVSAVNALIGRILRSSGKVRRGIGSVRQDVNVSIAGGTRVEIKGVSRTTYCEALTANEAFRQKALLDLRDELYRRGITAENFKASNVDVTSIFCGTEPSLLPESFKEGLVVSAVRLNNWQGLLATTTQPGRVFAHEIAGRVRVIACLDQLPNILYSDNPRVYGLTDEVWRNVRRAAGVRGGDGVILVWGDEEDVATACIEIADRAREATVGVPNETRQPLSEGLNRFERILPGPDRMYPDTDSPPTAIARERVRQIEATLPERLWEREERLEKLGIGPWEVHDLALSPWGDVFAEVVRAGALPAERAAAILCGHRRASRRTDIHFDKIPAAEMIDALNMLGRREILWPGFVALLVRLADAAKRGSERDEGGSSPHTLAAGIVERESLRPAPETEVDQLVTRMMEGWRGGSGVDPEAAHRALTGGVVYTLGVRADGEMVAAKIKKALGG